MYIVCELGYYIIVKYLVMKGVDLNLNKNEELSFFYIVFNKGYEKIVEFLLSIGINVNLCFISGGFFFL